jgi:hypothetical protein
MPKTTKQKETIMIQFQPEKIKELRRQVQLGKPLTKTDAAELREFLSTEAMLNRSFDFDEIAKSLSPGRVEEMHLRARNRRWAELEPQRPPVADPPPPFTIRVPSPHYMAAARERGRRLAKRLLQRVEEAKETDL